jgi:hypothetical protein
MNYLENFEVYRQIVEFKTPLASNPNKVATSSTDSYLIIINDEVYVQDCNVDRLEQFTKAAYSAEFVRINKNLFEKLA